MQVASTSRPLDLSVVVPLYRAATTLDALYERLAPVCTGQGWSWELVLVDDGSEDGTIARIEALMARDARVVGVFLSRNFGQHNATVAGIRESRGALVATLDEDLQHPPEALPDLLATLGREGADVVYGVFNARQHTWWRRWAARLVHHLPRRVMGVDFDISSFRVMNRTVADAVAASGRHDIILDVVIGWVTRRIAGCPVRHAAASRPSSYSLGRLADIWFCLVCGYTVAPLRIVLVAGVLMSLVAIVIGARAFYIKVACGGVVEGYTSLIVAVTFTAGLILVSLGFVAEYLARVFLQISQKPQAVVRRVARTPPSSTDVVHG